MTSQKSNSKLDELKNLEKLYTQSKQSQPRNKKFKEFDLSYKDFAEYNDLVSKQKVIDEKKFYHNIEIGQAHKNQVEENMSDEESEKKVESLFDEEKDQYEENIDSTQCNSLLQEYYTDSNNSDQYVANYNDEYNMNLKQQRIAYYSLIGLVFFIVLSNIVQLVDSLLKVDPQDLLTQQMKYYSPYIKFVEFSGLIFFAQQIGIKIKESVTKKRIRYANTSFIKEKLLQICLHTLIYFLQNSNKEDNEQQSNQFSLAKIVFVRILNLITLIAFHTVMQKIESLQHHLTYNILKKPQEIKDYSFVNQDNEEDTSLF